MGRSHVNAMSEGRDSKLNWLDLLWLLLLAGLAVLPPIQEYHKQLILLAFGILQLSEGWLVARLPSRGPAYIVLLKIALATVLIDHTNEIAINSYYYLPQARSSKLGRSPTNCWRSAFSSSSLPPCW